MPGPRATVGTGRGRRSPQRVGARPARDGRATEARGRRARQLTGAAWRSPAMRIEDRPRAAARAARPDCRPGPPELIPVLTDGRSRPTFARAAADGPTRRRPRPRRARGGRRRPGRPHGTADVRRAPLGRSQPARREGRAGRPRHRGDRPAGGRARRSGCRSPPEIEVVGLLDEVWIPVSRFALIPVRGRRRAHAGPRGLADRGRPDRAAGGRLLPARARRSGSSSGRSATGRCATAPTRSRPMTATSFSCGARRRGSSPSSEPIWRADRTGLLDGLAFRGVVAAGRPIIGQCALALLDRAGIQRQRTAPSTIPRRAESSSPTSSTTRARISDTSVDAPWTTRAASRTASPAKTRTVSSPTRTKPPPSITMNQAGSGSTWGSMTAFRANASSEIGRGRRRGSGPPDAAAAGRPLGSAVPVAEPADLDAAVTSRPSAGDAAWRPSSTGRCGPSGSVSSGSSPPGWAYFERVK